MSLRPLDAVACIRDALLNVSRPMNRLLIGKSSGPEGAGQEQAARPSWSTKETLSRAAKYVYWVMKREYLGHGNHGESWDFAVDYEMEGDTPEEARGLVGQQMFARRGLGDAPRVPGGGLQTMTRGTADEPWAMGDSRHMPDSYMYHAHKWGTQTSP